MQSFSRAFTFDAKDSFYDNKILFYASLELCNNNK